MGHSTRVGLGFRVWEDGCASVSVGVLCVSHRV